ncbi:MAG TPA: hypothetical protein PLU99_09665, partial [Phycisphaerae bacterium]|nr:hypothetical protein [Phycisphaerae bacterium]
MSLHDRESCHVACLFVVAVVFTVRAQAADPPRPSLRQPVDYVRWVNEEFSRGITENAAEFYQRALSEFSEDDSLEKFIAEADASTWTPEQRRQRSAWVQKNATCLEHFAKAARMDACYFPLPRESGALVSVMLPELSTFRAIAKLMTVRARLRLLEGNVDGATEDVALLLRAGRHLQDQPFLIQYLVGLSINGLAYRVLLDMPRLAPRAPDYEKVLSK